MAQKLKWILGITIVFFLILATNYIDRNNFRRIQDSLETIYEDRLVVQHLILNMMSIVHEKSERSCEQDTTGFFMKNQMGNATMDQYLEKFNQTRLTSNEAVALTSFEKDMARLVKMEENNVWAENKQAYSELLERLKTDIHTLSEIQLEEGKRQMHIGKRVVQSVDLITTYEIYVLAFLALLIQILVIYQPKTED